MTTLFIGMDGALASVRQRNGAWVAHLHLLGDGPRQGLPGTGRADDPRCVAADPLRPEQVYCGTGTRGVWCSGDGGATWEPSGSGIAHQAVYSLAVSPTERVDGYGVVYAGTEPSALYRSEDRGRTWRELSALRDLPSAPTWSFPPRPHTSHVRWITADPLVRGRVFVCIEAGALVRSQDGGRTWRDRVPTGPYDTHTLAMHRLAPDRLYSAAGDGYFESTDGGETWRRVDAGLEHGYVWGLAVDPADPDTVVLSAASSPREAHDPAHAESFLYRRSGDGAWHALRDGLPGPRGLLRPVLAARDREPGTFYAASNRGVFRSTDGGRSWDDIRITWPEGTSLTRVDALVVV